MGQGKFIEAARLFEELAEPAKHRAPRRAPQLFLQAGVAWLKAGEAEKALARLREGLFLMGRLGLTQRMHAASHRVLAELRQHELDQEADALKADLEKEFPALDLARPAAAAPARAHLPARCPYCGGNVRSDEVEWIDDHTAACDYCGSTLEAEA